MIQTTISLNVYNTLFCKIKSPPIHLFFLLIFSIFLMYSATVNSAPVQQEKNISVDFVTLRNRTGASSPSQYFGGARGQLRAGACTVSFSPIWGLDDIAQSVPFYIPDEKIKLNEVKEIEMEQLFTEISTFSKQENSNFVIYIHGYNVDFARSCRRSAIFQRALGLYDRLLLFSWPSDGNMLKYTWDEADLVWSVPHIAQLIEEIVKRAGSSNVDMVAHSLGARGTVQALARLAHNREAAPILNELVLIAPDMDRDIFRQELSLIKNSVKRLTIYVSENDKALKLSHEVHGYPRLGMAGKYLTVFEGVETIDISQISNRRISGHLYHLFNAEVIEDLTQLLHTGETASKRLSLKAATHNGLPFWQMIPKN